MKNAKINTKIPIVYPSKLTASFFFSSRYHITGLPKIVTAITATEITKSNKNIIGDNIVSSSFPIRFNRLLGPKTKTATSIIYEAASPAFIKAFFIISFFIFLFFHKSLNFSILK